MTNMRGILTNMRQMQSIILNHHRAKRGTRLWAPGAPEVLVNEIIIIMKFGKCRYMYYGLTFQYMADK